MFELQTVVGLLLAAVPFSNKAKKKKSMLVTLSLLLVFLAPASQLTFNLEGRKASITRQTGSSVVITCGVLAQTITYMHWYKYQEGEAPERLLYYDFSKSKFVVESGIISGKYHAYKFTENSCKFVIRNLDRNDIGVYFCAAWDSNGEWVKIFGGGTKLIVTERLDGDFSPKPTVFLPSVAEIEHHKAGTYLCLLENFFPDVIRVDWKEKNDNQILESQQGNTLRTDKTYMKFSWLTVTENSMDKEYKCVIKHEFNERGIDQEILFPSVNKAKEYLSNTFYKKSRVRREATKQGQQNILEYTTQFDESEQEKQMEEPVLDTMGQQLSSTSAYYAYLLLLLKSTIYFAITAFSLIRTTA